MRPDLGAEAVIRGLAARGLLPLVVHVCERRGVLLAELCGHVRSRGVVAARHEVWYLLRHDVERSFSYPELGRIFGYDHTTVREGVLAHAPRAASIPG
jgi:chromosomal replication initiation ATPase DnaA